LQILHTALSVNAMSRAGRQDETVNKNGKGERLMLAS
jgi:hypothetical protein